MPETNTMGKLKRSAHLFYIDAAFGGETPSWFLVGKDVEDMAIELNPDTETVKNILDETVVRDNGYEPSISVDTYYANPSDGAFYTHIKDIAINRLTGDDCKTKVLEVLMKRLFKDPESIPSKDLQEAVDKAFWFVGGGDIPKSEPSKVKLIDWKHDESIIFPAVNKAVGCEVRAVPYMHWWTFIGCFGEIGEGLFSAVMNIRHKRAEGKKLEKWEREFLRKHKELVIIRTDEERQAIDETEEFLKTIT